MRKADIKQLENSQTGFSFCYIQIKVFLGGIKGDVNEDGTVNGTDIQEIINIIVEGE